MKTIETREIYCLKQYYNEDDARRMIAKKCLLRAQTELVSAIPLYIPYWLVTVGMELRNLREKTTQVKWAEMVVNGFSNRGLLVDGRLKLEQGSYQGIFLESTLEEEKIKEAAVTELMTRTKKFLNPPPTQIKEICPIYYPMALVKLRKNDAEEVQTFDYYRGGVDRVMMRYLHLRDRIFETDDVAV